MKRDIGELYNNYACSSKQCDYLTTAGNEMESSSQLINDGGYDKNKGTRCPKCKKDSLVFLKTINP